LFKKNIVNLLISYFGLAVGLFNTVFKPKILTSEEIGIFATIISLTLMLQLFTFGGSLGVLMKFYPRYKDTPDKARFVTSVVTFSYILLVLVIFALFLGEKIVLEYYKSSSLNDFFFYIPIYLVLSHTTEICERISRVLFVSVRSNIIRNVYFRFLNFSFIIYMYFSGISFGTYLTFFMFLNLFSVIQLVFLSVRHLHIKLSINSLIPDLKFLKQFASYALFMMFSSFSGVAAANVDKIMIGHYLSLSKTGIYSVALAITTTMNIIFDSFSRISQPKLSEFLEKNDQEGLKKVYYENLFNNVYFGVIAYALMCVFSHDILSALGREYTEGSYVIIIIATGLIFNLTVGMCGEIIALSGFYRFDFYSRTGLIIVVIVSNTIFIPRFGIIGAAVATASNHIVYDFIKMIFAYRKFGIHPFKLRTLTFYLSGIAAGSSAFLLKTFSYPGITSIAVISVFSFIVYDLILGYIFKYEFSLTKKLIMKYGRNK